MTDFIPALSLLPKDASLHTLKKPFQGLPFSRCGLAALREMQR